MAQEYQICRRCVMDTSDCEITFDEQGYCNHCTNYYNNIAKMMYKGEETDRAFESLIAQMKKTGRGRKYDCLIGVSGGVDSSYVAYLAKKHGLRALLVHLDNGWNAEVANQNVKNIVSALGFDFETCTLDKEMFLAMQRACLRASVPDMEAPTDMAIQGVLHRVAKKHGIKYIISGGNFATEGILPHTWFYDATDVRYLKSISYGGSFRKYPVFGFWQAFYFKILCKIKTVYFLNYVPYNKDEARNVLKHELGWEYYGGKHYESRYTGFVQAYILPEKFNIDYRRATFSTQICAGTMSREQALEELSRKAYNAETLDEEIDNLCSTLDISKDEFSKIMSEKPLLYRDYKNSEGRLQFLYSVYRFLTGKKDYRG